MTRIILIDNHDSFTYNLVESFRTLDACSLEVVTNDRVDLEKLADFDKIVLSPGPGLPEEFPVLFQVLERYHRSHAILGVCLGHQAIARFCGAQLNNLAAVFHGRAVQIELLEPYDYLFRDVASPTTVGLYHSWEVRDYTLPPALHVTARSKAGIVMGLAHDSYDLRGVQFHPESFITTHGKRMLENWVKGSNVRAAD